MKNDVWVRWGEFPWIDQPSPEAAMDKAVSFLKEKMGPRAEVGTEVEPGVAEAAE